MPRHLTSLLIVSACVAASVGTAAHPSTATSATPVKYTVRVTDVGGHPLQAVHITAGELYADEARKAVTDRKGTAVLRLTPGRWRLSFGGQRITGGSSDPTGYVARSRIVRVPARDAAVRAAVVLQPGAAVLVHAVDTAGNPARGVVPTVNAVQPYLQLFPGFDPEQPDQPSTPVTGQDGTALVRGVATGSAVLVCAGPNFASTTVGYMNACSQHAYAVHAGTVTDARIVLERAVGGTLTGRVRRSDGVAARARVEIDRSGELSGFVSTTRGGRFELGDLRPGHYRACAYFGPYLGVGPTGFASACGPQVTVSAGHTTTSVVTLHPGGAVRGRVLGPGGVPVAHAWIEADYPDGNGATTWTDTSGRFTFSGLNAGSGTLCVDTSYSAATARLPGGVIGTCHGHGRAFAVSVRRTVTVPPIRLRAGGAVTGTVRTHSGRPIADAYISASGRSKGDEGVDGLTDRHGHFALAGLVPGRYEVCAYAFAADTTDRHTCAQHLVAVRSGRSTGPVALRTPPTADIAIRVVDTSGRRVAGVEVAAVARCGDECDGAFPLLPGQRVGPVATAVTSEGGTVRLTGLESGTYDACLFAYYGATSSGSPATGYADRCTGSKPDLVVHGGTTTRRTVVLHDGGAVSGRITDADGQPLQGVRVHVQGSAADDVPSDDAFPWALDSGTPAPGTYSRTAADGTFTIYGVRPGARRVCVVPPAKDTASSAGGYLPQCVGGAPGSKKGGTPVTVSPDATTSHVDLSLTAAGAISGKVTAAPTRQASAQSVVLFMDGKRVDTVGVPQKGSYQANQLVPGDYQVCAVAVTAGPQRGECYPHVAWDPNSPSPPAGAAEVTVKSAFVTPNIDIRIPK